MKSVVKNSDSETLPVGWTMTTIGQVVLKKVEQHVPSDSGTIRYIDIGSVDNAAKIITEAKPIPAATAPSRARQKVRAGDVLVSMTRPNLNAVALVPPELTGATASTGFDVLRSTNAVLSDWLFLHVRSQQFIGAMTNLVQGALYPAVRPSHIRTFPIPLPPLPEQRRIVARLETLTSRSLRTRALLAEVPTQLAQARQSLLASAFRGNETWTTERLAVVAEKPKNGYSAKPVDYATPYRVLSLGATTSSVFLRSKFKYFDEPIPDDSPFWLQPGDILVQRGNTLDYVGVPALYDGAPRKFIYPDLMMRVRAGGKVTTEYLLFALRRPETRAFLRERATGTAGNMPKINQQTLMDVPIPFPPLPSNTKS